MSQAESFEETKELQGESQEELHYQEFTYAELITITGNFQGLLGEGGFGRVYHGFLENGDQVAVKFIKSSTKKAFLVEARLLSKVHHRNLVSLIGYCSEENAHALVYEYMPQGNLLDHLNDNSGLRALSWKERLRIAHEAAQGLEHLHTGNWPVIVHRDVKTKNILLSQTLEAKITDFGMSKTYQNDYHNPASRGMEGTPGYIDPQYYNGQELTEMSDVYGFGVVLLELVTGKPSTLPPPEKCHISAWVNSRIDWEDINDIVDGRFEGDYDPDSVRKVIRIALQCTANDPAERPSMAEVVAQLKQSWEFEVAWNSKIMYSTGWSRRHTRFETPSPGSPARDPERSEGSCALRFMQNIGSAWRKAMAGIRIWWPRRGRSGTGHGR